MKDIAIVMAGGKGTRLYPISNPQLPKQFLPLLSDKPMIDETIDRIKPIYGSDSIIICSTMDYVSKVKKRPYKKILEPMGKGTAHSVLYSVLEVMEKYGDAIIHLIPSDHFIGNLERYHIALRQASTKAREFNKITLLGVEPESPDENYGYIRRVGHRITDFYEKPTKEMAMVMKHCGYIWNTGHFIFRASTMLNEFYKYQPELIKDFKFCFKYRCLDLLYKDLTPINIEKAIIEKSRKLAVIPSYFEWSDIGTIDRLLHVWKGDRVTYAEKIKAYERLDKGSRQPN